MKNLWVSWKEWEEQRWVKEWKRTRAKGENRFAISSGLICALLMVVLGVIINWSRGDKLLGMPEYPIGNVIFWVIRLVIGFAAGWAVAEIAWYRNERAYKQWEEKQVSTTQDRLC